MKKLKLTLLVLCAAIVSYSCEKTDDATPSVTFAQVNSILAANCQPCHVANSGANFEARAKFVDNYSISRGIASGILNRISRNPGEAGFMPINSSTKLSAENIQTIQDWIDGGFVEN